ncbi:efflux RND transporter permease subunit [Pseudomonas syringae pv. dysoxyli]|uniref:efflux RND transporter permease subunit n=1 Tax=Pseudomonas syringae TaxID=317 RepID=UPI001372F813|nr:multidrug efflux RND transporter permease subunit [Pseudomonas syringae]NAO28846.1 efflux RND transporter permease subunit [Pseudomonas syringae pv. dysoxyli]
MKFSRFFIDRPIFAAVIAAVIVLMGVIAAFKLPISEYPEVIPPQVLVHAEFPGANPKVIAETVAAPIEEKINGVENMLYMQSQASSDGQMTTTVTFKLGMDPNLAQQLVQNRVSQALPRLPEAVQRLGVTTIKASSTMTLAVTLFSPDDRYDLNYLHNYALIHVRDRLARIQGVGDVQLKGGGDYAIRVWLNPNKLAERHLTTAEVVSAIQAQNATVSAGMVGASPGGPNVQIQMDVNVKGRLQTPEEFEGIVVKTNTDGGVTYLRDLARVELGAADYTQNTHLNTHNSMSLWIYQQPGANALQIANDVHAVMDEIGKEMPAGLSSRAVYDPTRFVAESITAVMHTLLEAVALVVLVIILFLQNWRASLIPMLSVPVAIIGTFSMMYALDFSINALSLFGMVLAIGIVVDDAIVVVENVERNLEHGLSPREATYKAMDEVSKPIIAICLTLVAVFVPLAFMSGLTGQFYQQFAMTIAISTVISAFNSLTLSPALAALMLRAPDAPKDWLTRVIDRLFGRFFKAFNVVFQRGSKAYGGGVATTLRRKGAMMVVYVLLLGLAGWFGHAVPGGFVPAQDKQYLIAVAQLPNGASLDRSTEISQEMARMALKEPGIVDAVEHAGLSINGFATSSSSAVLFLCLDSFDVRYGEGANLSADAIAETMNRKFSQIKGAKISVFSPPPVLGLGTLGGFKLQIEDQGSQGYEALHEATQAFIAAAAKAPELGPLFSSYEINVPQLDVEVNRVKAQQLGVPVNEVFDTLQVYLGSLYVNDINRFGRVFQVRLQADAQYRAFAQDITQLKTRSVTGEMIPLGSLLTVTPTNGPEMVVRYNGFTASDLNGGPAAGYSMNQAQAAIDRIAKDTLPAGFKYEWTDLAYQQQLAGNAALLVFPICLLLVFFVLAAQYESLTLPLAVILIVPMSLLSALAGVWLTNGDNNILTQIGLVVLVGLSAKNAILIVEFARELEMSGRTSIEAAIEASRLRLRPILMTSLAFIMGVVPMVFASGPGSEMRQAIGISVFAGMLGVTFFSLALTPLFYVLMRKLGGNRPLHAAHHTHTQEIEA